MKKTKIVTIQAASCLIPYFSTHLVFFISMFRFKKLKARPGYWFLTVGIYFLTFLLSCFLTDALSESQQILMHCLGILIHISASISLIEIQKLAERCKLDESQVDSAIPKDYRKKDWNKFQILQIISSIIPILSTAFVVTATSVILKKNRSNVLYWLYMMVITTVPLMAFIVLVTTVLLKASPIWYLVMFAAVFAIVHYLCVRLQIKSNNDKQNNYKLNRKRIVWGCIGFGFIELMAVFLLCFITIQLDSSKIDDINGTDTSLAVLTEEKIVTSEDERYGATHVGDGTYGEQTNTAKAYRAIDYDKCVFHCAEISGIKDMQMTNISTDELILTIESTLESGNLEIFIIIDGALYEKVPIGQTYTTTLKGIANKNVLVRFGAESAKMSITVTREYEGMADGDKGTVLLAKPKP